MATKQTSEVLRHLRRTMLLREAEGLTDAELVNSFVQCREEAAFATLLKRHGPMVRGVCLRVLGNSHDAEDAFQATFLVLVRKAALIRPAALVGNWLYGVAYQAALQARRTVGRRRTREKQLTALPEPAVAEATARIDLLSMIDQALCGLPAPYRTVIVLCDLEEKTRKEVAAQLGVPEGTVGSRLARAREMLARRLSRGGAAVSSGALTVLLAENMASATVPTTVLSATINAASAYAAGQAATTGVISVRVAALTQGVLKTMLLAKVKFIFAVTLVLGALVVTGGMLAWGAAGTREQEQQPVSRADKEGEKDKRDADAEELKALQGTWSATALEAEGQQAPAEVAKRFKVVIKDNKLTFNPDSENRTSTFRLDVTKKPKQLIATPQDGPQKGKALGAIYSLDGDTLKLCVNNEGGPTPTEFTTKKGDGLRLLELKRNK